MIDAKEQMRSLGIDLQQVDREFDEIQRGEVKAEEQIDLIEVALQEGKKIREGRDNRI